MGSLPDLTERSRPASVRTAARTVSDPHRHHAIKQRSHDSLPDLTERSRPASVRTAARTVSDPHRHHAIKQVPVSTIYKKEWLWKKPKSSRTPTIPTSSRRRDSVASSVGAASVRRLIARQPPKIPKPVVQRFTLLCVASGLCATALLPFTAFAGAEAGAMPLAIMHTVAALVAPFSPLILQKTGTRVVITVAHVLVCVLLTAHTAATPLSVLLPLYGACGFALSPMSLALCASATTLAQAAGDECRRKIALRRALRALRAAQDLGLVFGSLLLGGALLIWPEDMSPALFTAVPTNATVPGWPPPDDSYFPDEDYEEQTCGAAGCPDVQSLSGTTLTSDGRRALVAVWALLALVAIGLGVYGATSAPAPPPDARSIVRDPRALLSFPMGLFIGLQQGFIYTSYIKWYGVCVGGWTCAWRALCGAGCLQALAAATLSMAAARGRRGALAAGGAAAHASLMLALLRWRAARTDLALPAVAAAAWGACAALWDVLQSGICIGGPGWRGPWSLTLAARHAGLALACAARHLICARFQIVALASALVAALVSQVALELRLRPTEAQRHRS
ncbi:uncharacterized protein LOC125236720 [Leguminivora glycinivorella]|uniref:uncharacterized protein LOC125236720 n=1 Tax=Leguminivora glycinivorella TaxID=1035111 RepID=UPI00200F0A9A|nr:uncharacterized protein LOC125236720 [Leguminivora glycinivorella]